MGLRNCKVLKDGVVVKKYIIPILWGLALLGFYILLQRFVTIEAVKKHADYVMPFMAKWFYFIVIIYFVIYTIISILPIPGETGLSFLGGYLFGPVLGLILVISAATLGALIAFYVIRKRYRLYLLRRYAPIFVPVKNQLEGANPLYLISLRLIPVIPFFVMNYAAGLTNMSPITFVYTTALGILPLCSLYVWAGRELRTITSFKDVLSWRILGLLLGLAFITMLPTIVTKLRRTKKPVSN